VRYLIVCDDEFPFYLAPSGAHGKVVFLCATRKLQRRLSRLGAEARSGELHSARFYRSQKVTAQDLVAVVIRDSRLRSGVVQVLLDHLDAFPITLVAEEEENRRQAEGRPPDWRLRKVSVSSTCRQGLLREMDLSRTAAQVQCLQRLFEGQERVLLLIQPDPDPDAIASALAMRTLLGRNKASTPIATFGKVSRPENQAMLELLDIEVVQIQPEETRGYDRVVLLDVQPSRFREMEFPVHVVVDHHPDANTFECAYKDIRPEYGATASILTEYLQAADVKISQKLATALLYGIKSDTFWLGREAAENDLQAFSFLYAQASHRLIRRMDRPQLPRKDLEVLSKAFREARVEEDVVFVHMEDLSREDVVPYIADFCLQVEGVEWAVVSGVYEGDLVVSVRNYGYTKAAGELLREAFADLGSAGGHRSMAKAVVPLEALGEKDVKALGAFVKRTFLQVYRKH